MSARERTFRNAWVIQMPRNQLHCLVHFTTASHYGSIHYVYATFTIVLITRYGIYHHGSSFTQLDILYYGT